MFERIASAKDMVKSGSIKRGIDEYFTIVHDLKLNENFNEAARILLQIAETIDQAENQQLYLQTMDKFILYAKDLELNNQQEFYTKAENYLEKAKTLYESTDSRLDKAGEITEVLIDYYSKIDKETEELVREAATLYGSHAVDLLTKSRGRIRPEEKNQAFKFLKKAKELYKSLNQDEKILDHYIEVATTLIEQDNMDLGEEILDKILEILMNIKGEKDKIVSSTEKAMQAYTDFIDKKINTILNPEEDISKVETVKFENNIAIPIIRHLYENCLQREAKPAITILARELSLIGLAIYEKNFEREAIPYFRLAKDYFSEVGKVEPFLEFGDNLISLGLQLYRNGEYPIGRDYFNIAAEIGQQVDKNFEVKVYRKQAENYLKYERYQLAIEALRQMIEPLKELPDNPLRMDMPISIRQLARERFEKNDFHYAEQMHRLSAEYFLAFDQVELAADTFDSAWKPMFDVRQLQTGIELASKAAEYYIVADKEEEAADVYFRLAKQLLQEGHYDIALERLKLAAETIPEYLRETKFKPLVEIATKYTEKCLEQGDFINASELWTAACEFNEILARAMSERDPELAVETIEEHITNVRKFNSQELYEITFNSAKGSAKILSDTGEHERAAKILVSFATDFLRKDIPEHAEPLFEMGAEEFITAKQPDEAARILAALARYHSEHNNQEKTEKYYLLASVENKATKTPKILQQVVEHSFETAQQRLKEKAYDIAEKTFLLSDKIAQAIDEKTVANINYNTAKEFFPHRELEYAFNHYQKAIENFQNVNSKKALILGAELIERGRKIFADKNYQFANKFIDLGVSTLTKNGKEQQAAQTARIEGERFLSTSESSIGLALLGRSIEIYDELNKQDQIAEINITISEFFIQKNELKEALEHYTEAGDNYLQLKKKKNIYEIIEILTKLAAEILHGGIGAEDLKKNNRESIASEYYLQAESFCKQLQDKQRCGEIVFSEWKIFSENGNFDVGFEKLKESLAIFKEIKNYDKITNITKEIMDYSYELIKENELIPATQNLEHIIDVLQAIDQNEYAAEVCITTCQEFMELKNNEVAVSWGLRGADILTEIGLIDEAIKFLEEAADQLMVIESTENAILCFGKIAKILEKEDRIKDVEETALKIMAFGTANMKKEKKAIGLRLWEVALTIGAIVGEEFTGQLSKIEGQTFFEINDYNKALEMFNESFKLFKRVDKKNRLLDLGDLLFDLAKELENEKEYNQALEYLYDALRVTTAAQELFVGTEKMFSHAKVFIEINREEDALDLINQIIDWLFKQDETAAGIEKCFLGASLLISYGKNTVGSALIDRGMEKISQIDDEAAIKHLSTICRNQGIILREEEKLAASHIMLASGIGILRTINDLTGIGEISIDLGKTLIDRKEMSAAVEAFQNGVKLLVQGKEEKEALKIVNDLVTRGRQEVDNDNTAIGIPLINLAGELFLHLDHPERIMMVSEIFINQGGKMLEERNFDVAALFFSKAMEMATTAKLERYLPKVGNRCIDFGLKMVKEQEYLQGIQFMNTGAEVIIEYEKKKDKTQRATTNFLEALESIFSKNVEKRIPDEDQRFELIDQYIDSILKFFIQIDMKKSLEQLTQQLIDYGKVLLKSVGPSVVRRIFEPALESAKAAENTGLQITIAEVYLSHVNYLAERNRFEYFDTILNQAINIYLEVGETSEIQKFMGIQAENGRELCLKEKTKTQGMNILTTIIDLAISLANPELFSVVIIPCIELNREAIKKEDFKMAIYARQKIIQLLNYLDENDINLKVVGSIDFPKMVLNWFKTGKELLTKANTFDQGIKIVDQTLKLAVITKQKEFGINIIDEILAEIDTFVRKKYSGVEILYEILADALDGLNEEKRVIELG
ncbi:MAG: hypothetical protein U9O98_06660, partial [Asgard group archaeon]|nr:hypothetical protein [Asgard group archaeon]